MTPWSDTGYVMLLKRTGPRAKYTPAGAAALARLG
jgi:hypothetical protein